MQPQHLVPKEPTTTEGALELFDASEPVDPDFMIGTWRGAELPTGHPLDGLLEATASSVRWTCAVIGRTSSCCAATTRFPWRNRHRGGCGADGAWRAR